MTNEEENTRSLYLLYGITEWTAKCNILTNEEQLQVLNDLKNGTNSRLSQLVKMPFPSFATEYFKDFSQAQMYFKDPTFAFKIYFLTENQLRIFSEYMRTVNEIEKSDEKKDEFNNSHELNITLDELMMMNFESIVNDTSSVKRRRTSKIKFLQLMSYIDIDIAKSMNLSCARLFEITGETRLDLEANLNLLNPTAKIMLILYIGLYGFKSHNMEEISNIFFGRNTNLTGQLINFLIPRITKSTKEFSHSIGYRGAAHPENMFEYSVPAFKKLNIAIEVPVLYNGVNEYTKAILDKMTSGYKKTYLVAKYMYKTPESLARNMNLSIADAQEKISRIQHL